MEHAKRYPASTPPENYGAIAYVRHGMECWGLGIFSDGSSPNRQECGIGVPYVWRGAGVSPLLWHDVAQWAHDDVVHDMLNGLPAAQPEPSNA